MTGIRSISPGPFTPVSLPSRKTTPRSYSRKMRMALARMNIRKTIAVISMILNDCSMMISFLFKGLISELLV